MNFRRGPDKIVVAFAHDEAVAFGTPDGKTHAAVVMDCEILLTELDAQNLINGLQAMLDTNPSEVQQ